MSGNTTMTTEAHARYKAEESTYNEIHNTLTKMNNAYFTLPDKQKETVLFLADLYSLMSVMTAVKRVETAFPEAVNAESKSGYKEIYDEHTILFHNKKARYSSQNMTEVDYGIQREMIENGQIDRVHQYKADNVSGIGVTKAAFSLAMLGFTEKMCIDAHVESYFNLDHNEVTNIQTVNEYERLCGSLRSRDPFLAEETCPYIFQWAVFDADKGDGVTKHKRWFETVNGFLDEELI